MLDELAFPTIADELTNYKQLLADNIFPCLILEGFLVALTTLHRLLSYTCRKCTCKQIIVDAILINLATSLATFPVT